MFKFFTRKVDEPLNHWISFADDFEMSPSEFYAKVEQELTERMVPKMEMNRIEFAEGGLLSEKRTYLRMLRERLVFDVCAAPFGKTFFFTCRTSEIPIKVNPWQVAACLSLLLVLTYMAIKVAGIFWAVVIVGLVFFGSIYVMRNLVAFGLNDLDKTFMQSPLFGSIYSAYLRRETYYRIDSRLCYLQIVPTVVKELAEEAAAQKGIKLIDQYQSSPILGDVYKRVGASGGEKSPSVGPELPPNPRLSI